MRQREIHFQIRFLMTTSNRADRELSRHSKLTTGIDQHASCVHLSTRAG